MHAPVRRCLWECDLPRLFDRRHPKCSNDSIDLPDRCRLFSCCLGWERFAPSAVDLCSCRSPLWNLNPSADHTCCPPGIRHPHFYLQTDLSVQRNTKAPLENTLSGKGKG